MASALGKRLAGSFSRARRITASSACEIPASGATSRGRGGASVTWAVTIPIGVGASNGIRPVTSSKSIAPTA